LLVEIGIAIQGVDSHCFPVTCVLPSKLILLKLSFSVVPGPLLEFFFSKTTEIYSFRAIEVKISKPWWQSHAYSADNKGNTLLPFPRSWWFLADYDIPIFYSSITSDFASILHGLLCVTICVFLLLLFIHLFICIYTVWAISPCCPQPPTFPSHPLAFRQNLFCPLLQFC
jgi:hypothetical protein